MDLKELLALSVKHCASDLHLCSGVQPNIRVDGDIQPLDLPYLSHEILLSMLLSLMTDSEHVYFKKNLEIDLAIDISDIGRFRANIFMQAQGVSAVFRLIPSDILSLNDLNSPDFFYDLTRLERGLVLITGPTGSGKSTTLAAMVDEINRRRCCHILTIEDPIEFLYQNKQSIINQRQVQRDTLSFHAALRSGLRQDPDVILIGEMRDLETIKLALTAAETGHLVFATLHTNSAAKTINRLIDVFSGEEKSLVRNLVSESLQAVVSQKLIKKKGGGRVAAYEILKANTAVRHMIKENKLAQMYSHMQTGAAQGMQTMEQATDKLFRQGTIEMLDVM